MELPVSPVGHSRAAASRVAAMGSLKRQPPLSLPGSCTRRNLIKLLADQTTLGWNPFCSVVGATWSEQTFVHISPGKARQDQMWIHNLGQAAVFRGCSLSAGLDKQPSLT